MLQRATGGLYAPGRWVNWRRGLVTGPTAMLLRYMVILAALTAVGCLYIWQANNLRALQLDTSALRATRIALEQDNVNLVNQLALWNTPAYVHSRAKEGNFVAPQQHVVLQSASGEEAARTQPGGVR